MLSMLSYLILSLESRSLEVERDSWDEQRLRALCAHHGWDFEWMTEDGERRRRANERFAEWKLEELSRDCTPSRFRTSNRASNMLMIIYIGCY